MKEKKSVLNAATKDKFSSSYDYSSMISGIQPKTEVATEPEEVSEEKAVVEESFATVPKKVEEKAPEGYKINPMYVEKRTRRVQLIFQPSLYAKVEDKYRALGYKSFNDYVHSLLEEQVK